MKTIKGANKHILTNLNFCKFFNGLCEAKRQHPTIRQITKSAKQKNKFPKPRL